MSAKLAANDALRESGASISTNSGFFGHSLSSSCKYPKRTVSSLVSERCDDTKQKIVTPDSSYEKSSERTGTNNDFPNDNIQHRQDDDDNAETETPGLFTETADASSREASRLLREDPPQLQRALDLYHEAAVSYGKNTSIISICNSAGCYRNMGAVTRLLREPYQEGLAYLQRSLGLYEKAQELIQPNLEAVFKNNVSDDRNECDRQTTGVHSETLCLDLMVLETMHSLAIVLFQQSIEGAGPHSCEHNASVKWSQRILGKLLDMQKIKMWDDIPAYSTQIQGVYYTPLSQQSHAELLATSLEQLGILYTSSTESAPSPDRKVGVSDSELSRLNEGVALLRDWCISQPEKNAWMLRSLSQALRQLSQLYLEKERMDIAISSLQDAIDLQEPSNVDMDATEIEQRHLNLHAMDSLGMKNENMGQYDNALVCYESSLLARSRYCGDEHIDVAKSLIHVARVMELQGNTEGALDLYKHAHSIYGLQITNETFMCQAQGAGTIVELVENLMKQGRFEEARAYLTKCLAIAEQGESDSGASFAKRSVIYYDLGRAYIGLEDYVSATICLVEAAKFEESDHGLDEEKNAYALLRQVEVLQSKRDGHAPRGGDGRSFGGQSSQLHIKQIRNSSSITSANLNERESEHPVSVIVEESVPRAQQHTSSRSRTAEESQSRDNFKTEIGAPSIYSSRLFDVDADVALESSSSAVFSKPVEADFTRSNGSSAFFQSKSNSLPDDTNRPRHFENSHEKCTLQSRNTGTIEQSRTEYVSSNCIEDDRSHNVDSIPPPIDIAEQLGEFSTNGDLVQPSRSGLSDDFTSLHVIPIQSPLSSDSNFEHQGKNGRIKSRRNLRLGWKNSPRRGSKDETSVTSERSRLSKGLSLRRVRRHGFQSLPEDDEGIVKPVSPYESEVAETEEDGTEEESLLFDGPVAFLDVKKRENENCDDDEISDITMRFDATSATRETSQEWWWGVTAEGFGRWFPASYVSQAVQAADAFLTAKTSHLKPRVRSKNESEEISNNQDEIEVLSSGDFAEIESHVGTTSAKVSLEVSAAGDALHPFDHGEKTESLSHRHHSLFSSSGPHHFGGDKDILLEISSYRELVAKQQQTNGKEHPSVATSWFTLAVLYSRDKDVDSAIECATEALRIQTKNGDVEDASRSLHFLGDVHLHQKEYKRSIVHYSNALRRETEYFGYSCDATARTLNCIGTAKSFQSDFKGAMESHEEALRILQECNGENLQHPLVSETLCRIGSVYYRERNSLRSSSSPDGYSTFIEGGMLETIGRAHEDRGSYKMAISFFEEKLQSLESENESRGLLEKIATTLNGLGMLSSRAGLFYEAIDYYKKSMRLQMQTGCDEVQRASAQVLTASVRFQLGEWRQSYRMLEDSLITLEEELGSSHETVAATYYQIGVVQTSLCEYDDAMDALKTAVEIQIGTLGEDHPATLRTRRQMGNVHALYTTEVDTAMEYFDLVLKTQKKIHGDRHPNIAETLHSIGRAHISKGDYAKAIRALEECYYMRVEFLGWDHPLQGSTLHDIAVIHMRRGRLKKSLHICEVVLGLRKEALSDRHVDVARTLCTKGSCLVAQGETENALECLMDGLEMAGESLGMSHPIVAELYAELGGLQLRKCQFDAARTSIQKALDIYCWSNLDDDYYGIQDAKDKLERVERDEMLCV